MATNKKGLMVYADREIEDRIYALRKQDQFCRLSKSQLISYLIKSALENIEHEQATDHTA